jgi:hypothetical protein
MLLKTSEEVVIGFQILKKMGTPSPHTMLYLGRQRVVFSKSCPRVLKLRGWLRCLKVTLKTGAIYVNGGPSRGYSVLRPGEERPHGGAWNFTEIFKVIFAGFKSILQNIKVFQTYQSFVKYL